MNRDEQLEKFLTKYAKPKNFQAILELDSYCKENKLFLAEKMKKSFCELFEKVKSVQDVDKKEIKIITLGVSRTFTVLKQHKAVITAYDENFYFEKKPTEIELDLSEYFSFYENLEKELLLDIKRYIGLVNKSDVQKFMQSNFRNYVRYVTNICKLVLRDIEKETLFADVIKSYDFKVYSGEHKSNIELVYSRMTFDEEIQKNALELVDNHTDFFTYESFCSVNLEDKDFRNGKFEYCFFNNSNFDSSDFYLGFFIGTSFRSCSMKFANFESTVLIDADFGNANLHSATFEKSSGTITKPIEDRLYSPGFLGVNFKGADLREVSFAEADFTSANFENAKFANTDFTNTILKDAVFTKASLDELKLSEKQISEIVIV